MPTLPKPKRAGPTTSTRMSDREYSAMRLAGDLEAVPGVHRVLVGYENRGGVWSVQLEGRMRADPAAVINADFARRNLPPVEFDTIIRMTSQHSPEGAEFFMERIIKALPAYKRKAKRARRKA